jgi:hypothetical protein
VNTVASVSTAMATYDDTCGYIQISYIGVSTVVSVSIGILAYNNTCGYIQ